ncbi:taste receptor type 1 member 1-like [Brachionichthys hirsutus]|uniref:taste receptor type 1 member 1-like n=1 Tax=Brachionichthys hirsutus TaxID=412623 RepID=UPI003604A55A
MKRILFCLCLVGSLRHSWAQCTFTTSEFHLEGDYVIGGLFDIHHDSTPVLHDKPEAVLCSSKRFVLSSYRRFQLMRFSVAEINHSSQLLPNVSLGYEIFDHCSDVQNFPGILKLISFNDLIQPWGESDNSVSKLIAVVGTYTSTEARTVAPLFMTNLIPMVSYGAASSIFSRKQNFPSFLRTVHPNEDVIQVIVRLVRHFAWRWVAFLNIDDDYGNDGLALFIKNIKDTEICLAYTKGLNYNTDYSPVFRQIESHGIHTIIVFAPEWTAEALIKSAIQQNVTDKVWIAGDAWSLNKKLPKEKGIRSIGTILGVAEQAVAIPGFNEFIDASKNRTCHENAEQQMFCNQVCNCSWISAKDIIDADPSFNFPVYSAVYAVAHALHSALECGAGTCKGNITKYPHMVLAELRKSNFTLLNRSFEFNENGDPKYGSYAIVLWNHQGEAEEVGIHEFHPSSFHFYINSSKILWHTNGKVPTSLCSQQCKVGYAKKHEGIHKCCFTCEICPNGTYVNITDDPYKCIRCKETEWSEPGSTSCRLREVEYVPYTDIGAILIMVSAWVFVGLTLATSLLFAINYNTPVVRSAGGPMCFLILGCLKLCTVSAFFYFDKPTISFCVLRFLPFILFYTVCLACFVVRSFQIVCIFKIAAKFPKLHSWWMKYHGQWLVITAAFATQAVLLLINLSSYPPNTYNDTFWYPDKIVLGCVNSFLVSSMSTVFLGVLCSLCFIFSYMGKDLPKNYNEAKALTFCLFLLTFTWIVYSTVSMLYRGKYLQILSALAILSSVYSFLLLYFLPKCYIIIFQSYKNTQQYFQSLIQNYTKTISQ